MDTPHRFLNNLNTNKHILLLYDDPEEAKKIEFQFIDNGLEKGEHCIYATEEDPEFIQEKMEEHGIDVNFFLEKGLLHISQPDDPNNHPEGILAGAKNSLERILKNSTPPYRIVASLIPDTEIPEIIDVHLKIEKEFHANFENFDGSIICPYNIKNLEQNNDSYRIRKLFDSHHSVLYAQSFEGRVLKMS